MDLLRTPDERFAALPDFPYQPRYVDLPDGPRMAYVDEGEGPVVLLLHGEPSWSFLYRHVIRVLVEGGCRAVAPDMIGFGRSDKPAGIADHTYARHIAWTAAFVDALGLKDVTLVGQDWGGLIGLRLAVADPGRYARIVAANTGLPTGDFPMPETWLRFREAVRSAGARFDVPRGIQSGCTGTLPPEVLAAYDAPFPDESYKAGPRAMPGLVPAEPDDVEAQPNRDAWEVLRAWDKPFLVAFSDRDPITGPMAGLFQSLVPGARGIDHPVLEGAGHFLQEDAGERLGREIVRFVRD
ncbi:haloalkane dehalogenase [Planobispora takensis]|uniref:Haloalkane dehalogenase n=1 Tax=Planobispora takensis TaxID=1367882 RepID=A0A8J3WWQ9_9ACTN|nr:haloalkane dehalogenase [Planobispora takensis]GII04435.1 haloalkane dehalogenase [Planobispora takensis]